MDALMVVHQLHRLASDPSPSQAVISKLPRMAVGICYFLEHPDIGIQHEAAKGINCVAKIHSSILGESFQCKELVRILSGYASTSEDSFVREYCQEALEALVLYEKEDTFSRSNTDNSDEEKNDCNTRSASNTEHENVSSEAKIEDIIQLERNNNNKTGTNSKKQLDCEDAKNKFKSKYRENKINKSKNSESDDYDKELVTVLYGLRRIKMDYGHTEEWRNKDMPGIQKLLQYRLVLVPGVKSASITLNTNSLHLQMKQRDTEMDISEEGENCVENKEKEKDETSDTRDIDRCDFEHDEGDGVSVILMKLSLDMKRREEEIEHVRVQCGRHALLLQLHSVSSQPFSLPSSAHNEYKHVDGDIGYLDDLNVSKNNADFALIDETRKDDFERKKNKTDGKPGVDRNAETLKQKKLCNENEVQKSMSSGRIVHETAAGFCFFSQNSALFSQSKFLGSNVIIPYDDDPELASRLRREKERKAEERRNVKEKQTVLDRVLGNIGKVKFW